MIDILTHLREVAMQKSTEYPDEDFVLRGLWRIDYRYRPSPWERDLAYSMVVAQTTGQGCCYVDYGSASIDDHLLGTDGREITDCDHYTSIAILDAIYSVFKTSPEQSFDFKGGSAEKAARRARIVVDQVMRELWEMGGERVLNVGVMGIFIKHLKDLGVEVIGTDYVASSIGNKLHEADIFGGERTMELIDDVDVVLATGMTLTTSTLGPILEAVQERNKRLILFAATGASFAQEYCEGLGVDVVVSEPQPQYMFQGTSSISIFRKNRLATPLAKTSAALRQVG
jgi:hypothetical protein